MSVSEYFKAQAGKESRFIEFVILIAVLVMLMVLIGLTLYTEQPYVIMIDYRYKSNYYKPFVLPDGYDIDTQGRAWSNWDVNEKGIMQVCDLFNASMGYFNTKRKSSATKLGKRLLEEWIIAYLAELEKTDIANEDFNDFPWGNNWYEFTITSTTTMAYYIMLKDSLPSVKTSCAKVIQLIIKDPQTSLGWTRDKANSAMMVLPYTLAHKITGTLDTETEPYRYAINQYNLKPDETLRANEDGVHIDYSYLIHNGVYAYGYFESIYNIYPDTMQVIPEVKSFNLEHHHDMWTSKLYHPTIPMSGSTLFHRRRELNCGTYKGKTKTPSVVVVPSMKYLRIFGSNYQWSVRLGGFSIAYYECDQTVYDMGLYSCLCKERFEKGGSTEATFPRTGFVYANGTKELVPVDPNPLNIERPTTTTYYNIPYSDKAHSYVFVDYDEGCAYFQAKHSGYEPLLDLHIDESGYYDFKTEILEYELAAPLNPYIICWGKEEVELDFKNSSTGEYHAFKGTINMRTGETTVGKSTWPDPYEVQIHTYNPIYTAPYTRNEASNVSHPVYYPTGSGGTTNYSIITKHDKPFIYCPSENDVLSKEIMAKYKNPSTGEDAYAMFIFDTEWNQYLWDEYKKTNAYYKPQLIT
ncbi:ODV-E66 [Penaeus monodon nudivirus]|uniref:ODV-E66 n=1 Tax=Penaeus monodon nudivirus TaxID=1529056 RepID=A0A076FEL8_9VIRU|nr:ODV-E66 [Penaeus monodon nudivirus]AII15824.1 ODV-E66 [Penaeus monodon nudivirus]